MMNRIHGCLYCNVFAVLIISGLMSVSGIHSSRYSDNRHDSFNKKKDSIIQSEVMRGDNEIMILVIVGIKELQALNFRYYAAEPKVNLRFAGMD